MRKIRNLVWHEAFKRERIAFCTIGFDERRRPNVRGIWRQMQDAGAELAPSTLQRVMTLDRAAPTDSKRDYVAGPELKTALMLWLNIESEAELIRAWDRAPLAPPIAVKDRRDSTER
tara:strand:- start:4842 stop:5192 length:351 start_codon:yes stop_codon:yes gene_type:complete